MFAIDNADAPATWNLVLGSWQINLPVINIYIVMFYNEIIW